MIPWLDQNAPAAFPGVECALAEPAGLLCAGGNLEPDTLVAAYTRGIFPWFSDDQPILWWSTDPRMVLFPDEFRISKSLAKTIRSNKFEIRVDTAFHAVIHACSAPREPGGGTWIVPAMQAAYTRLHQCGIAHSVESWRDGRLTGGLYGVALGRVFFGESMFALETDASKVALAALVARLNDDGFQMIDCQQQTRHLASFGARPITRQDFSARLQELINSGTSASQWGSHASASLAA